MPAKLINSDAQHGPNRDAATAVVYTRVSSKEQEQEGYSLDAQQRLLREYASEHGIVIEKEFVDVETARTSGRTQFGGMLNHVRRHRAAPPIILVEKIDRLHRNITDWAKLDELGVTIHFVKDCQIIGPGSKSADQLVHGIRVVVARNCSQNLGKETIKSMMRKRDPGSIPAFRRSATGTSRGRTVSGSSSPTLTRQRPSPISSTASQRANIPLLGWPQHSK